MQMKLKDIWRAVGTALLIGITQTTWSQGFTTLHNFANAPDGANPGQLEWANGFFYGPTANGGTGSSGSIYRFNPSGPGFATIYSFTGATNNGNTPNSLLVTGSMIYGTTILGGTNSVGMIFAVNTNGTGFTSLYSFGLPPDGHYPEAGLVLSGSTLYGTTYTGGITNGGTIFKINTNGSSYAALHWFTNSPDGYSPQSELVASGSTLFGTTAFGGSNGYGIIFSIATNGANYTILHSFTNTPDGRYPYGGLVLDSGFLYGTTGSGGSNNNGTVFAISTNGSGYKILHHFTSPVANTDGSVPKGTLTLNAGIIYGTASGGGSGNGGTVFQLNTNGTGFAVIKNFTFNPGDGNVLENGVLLLGSTLWGTTYSGGTGGYGILYSLPLAPAISQQPTDLTVINGSPASFTNVASGAAPLAYQWYLNTNTLVSGATSAILLIPSATALQAGYYSGVVTNSFGSVTSSAARLTVSVTATAPSITQQPQNLTVNSGSPASFTAAASGTSPLFYQWYFNTNTPVNGGTGATLNLPSVTTLQAGYYSVIVTNIAGSATSSAAKLTVNVPATAPSITQQPQNLTVTNGNPASFTAAASGTAPLFYQWYFNTNTPVSGGTGATLNLASATTNQAGYYSVIVTNLAGSATSSAARLTVVVPVAGPVITGQPQNSTVTNGYDASFTTVASGNAPLYYQWYFNTNTPVVGGTNSILIITSAATNDAGYYSVIVSNADGSTISSPAKLTVVSTKPIIFVQPGDLAGGYGRTASINVTADGQSPLKFQWYSNTVATQVFDVAHRLAGKTNATLTFTALFTNVSYYSVIITNTLGNATSSPAKLTIYSAPLITTNPAPTNVFIGDPASFNVGVAGASILRYQWYFNTNNVQTNLLGSALAGQTNTTLAFSAVTSNLLGRYSVIVTNTYGRATSSPALLALQTVVQAGQPKFLSFSFDPVSSSFSFTVSNTPSSANRLWASTNLTSASFWRVIASNTMAANGLWLFTDPNIAKTNQARFYRASAP